MSLALTCAALVVMAGGAAARQVFVVMGGYAMLALVLGHARRLLRSIDAGDLPADGRRYAFFAWFLGMAGSALAALAILQAVFG